MVAASRGAREEAVVEAPVAVNGNPAAPADTMIDGPGAAAPMAAGVDVPDPA
jgi:hypothetical protein